MTTRTTSPSPFVIDRVQQLVDSYPKLATDYDANGNLTTEGAERIIEHVMGRLTAEQRDELAEQEIQDCATRSLEYCVEVGAAERFRNNRGEVRYKKLRNVTEAENAAWNAREAMHAGFRQLIATRCYTARR